VSDRRSFSEIPPDLLRDHGVDARVERVWERLQVSLPSASRRRRPSVGAGLAVALAAATFGLGVFVGARFSRGEPAPFASLGAEPAEGPKPVQPAPLSAGAPSIAARDVPPARQARHSVATRRADTVSPGVMPEPEPVAPSTPAAPAAWQHLADEGKYTDALAALEEAGGFDAALRDATADQLMSLVDVARATGQRERAVLALRRIVSEHGADPNAPVAAWMLGNELAKAHDLASAEQAFAMYRALSPNGDFAEDALARQIDMAVEQGNQDHARRLAEQYLKEFPDGPRTADIQALLERWAHEASATVGAAAESGARGEGPPASAPDAGAR
jgi:TolA-binding protein